MAPWERTVVHYQKFSLSLSLPPKKPTSLHTGDYALGEEKYSDLGGITGHWFWMTLIPGDPKCHQSTSQSKSLWKPGDVTEFSFRYISQWVQCIPNPSCGYSTQFWKAKLEYSQQLAESLHWFPDLWSQDCCRKGKWKPVELPLPKKTINQNQYCISGGTSVLPLRTWKR